MLICVLNPAEVLGGVGNGIFERETCDLDREEVQGQAEKL